MRTPTIIPMLYTKTAGPPAARSTFAPCPTPGRAELVGSTNSQTDTGTEPSIIHPLPALTYLYTRRRAARERTLPHERRQSIAHMVQARLMLARLYCWRLVDPDIPQLRLGPRSGCPHSRPSRMAHRLHMLAPVLLQADTGTPTSEEAAKVAGHGLADIVIVLESYPITRADADHGPERLGQPMFSRRCSCVYVHGSDEVVCAACVAAIVEDPGVCWEELKTAGGGEGEVEGTEV
ncbi:hypothetical protein V8D89_001317 [Ganoderma adspersum]